MKALAYLCLLFALPAWSQGQLKVTPLATTITVNLTASPTSGTCPYNANLQWSATNASGCTKSGSWSGNVPSSGSESVQINNAQMTFTLSCSAQTESALLQWTNPTQNVDGTAVILKGNKVFHGAMASGLGDQIPIILQPATTQYLVTGLPAGVRYFGVKATSNVAPNLDSDMAGPVQTSIVLPAGAKTINVGCTTPPTPKPPTGVTVSSTVWDSLPAQGGRVVGIDVGRIPLGVKCLGQKPMVVQDTYEYWHVKNADVTLYRDPRPGPLLGRCELSNT